MQYTSLNDSLTKSRIDPEFRVAPLRECNWSREHIFATFEVREVLVAVLANLGMPWARAAFPNRTISA